MKEKTRKTIGITALIAGITLLASACAFAAQDYPSGYLGEGFRKYLGGKIQKGYYVDAFTRNDFREKSSADKGNQIAELLGYAAQATPESENKILYNLFQQKDTSNAMKTEIAQRKQQREQVASAKIEGGFTYVPYSDGKIEYFKDGLVIRIENERVVDEFGNVAIKNSSNFQYNDKRMMTSYEASLKDHLGNTSKLFWYGATYTADSVYYGSGKTSANRNLTEYYLKEIDAAGNVKLSHWKANNYEGKLLRAFTQTIDETVYNVDGTVKYNTSVSFTRSNIAYADGDPGKATSYHEEGVGADNLSYTLDRSNTTYNDKYQALGYHEERKTTQIDGGVEKVTTDAKFEYGDTGYAFGPDVEADPSRLAQTVIITKTENGDGSYKVDTTTTKYDYSGTKMTNAYARSEFGGQEAKWNEYKDAQGHTLTRKEKDGKVTYSYVDPDTLETVTVDEKDVSSAVKDGNKYSGVSEIQFETTFGTPMAKTVHSTTSFYAPYEDRVSRIEDSTLTYDNGFVSDSIRFARVRGTKEHTEVTSPLADADDSHRETRDTDLTYYYDANANLYDAKAAGTGNAWEYSGERGWYGKYTFTSETKYVVILGRALSKETDMRKTYAK